MCLRRFVFRPLPIKWREVAVRKTAFVVPIDAKHVDMASRRLCESQTAVGGMTQIIKVNWLLRFSARNATDRLINRFSYQL